MTMPACALVESPLSPVDEAVIADDVDATCELNDKVVWLVSVGVAVVPT